MIALIGRILYMLVFVVPFIAYKAIQDTRAGMRGESRVDKLRKQLGMSKRDH